MNVLLYRGEAAMRKKLERMLRLRWPETKMMSVSDEDLPARLPDAQLILVADSQSEEHGGTIDAVRIIAGRTEAGIVVLARKPSDGDMLDVLEAGADDYLPASVSATRFVGRIFALMRRINWSKSDDDGTVQWGPLSIETECHEARIDDRYLPLTPTEFQLLYHLARAGGSTMTADALQKLIWDSDQPLYLGSLRKYVQRLRRKLRESDSASGTLGITAIRGVGYRLVYQGKGAA